MGVLGGTVIPYHLLDIVIIFMSKFIFGFFFVFSLVQNLSSKSV